jgi:hypothetical protein
MNNSAEIFTIPESSNFLGEIRTWILLIIPRQIVSIRRAAMITRA